MQQTQKSLRVSVVIPAYNEEEHLVACLDALAVQTVSPYEVIVVDNNSSDKTIAIAKKYPFVHILHEPKHGIVYARNRGFMHVTGDIIGRIDADTIVPTDWVAHIQSFYSQPAHRQKAWTSPGIFTNVQFPAFSNTLLKWSSFDINRLLLGYPTLWGSSMVLLREQWQVVAPDVHIRDDIHEDVDLSIQLVRRGYGIYLDPTIRVKATLRRLTSNRETLWYHLYRWPQTLRVNHRKSWILLIGVVAIMRFLLVPAYLMAARLRQPLRTTR